MKMLIADDDPTMRMVLRAGLTQLGYEVEAANNGEDAWALLQREGAAEIAILDWMMPGMTGIDICRKLRQREDAPYVYVILLTGMDSLDDLVKGLEAGADDYLTKPFKAPELNARLRAGRRVLDLQRDLLAAQAELTALANVDSLTGVWNRRVILERLDLELSRAERGLNSVGVVMLDIDHFKRINDSLGHLVGDEVLQQVANRLREAVRPYDNIGRYGGEEFLIVAPGCNLDDAFQLAERIRRNVCQAPIQSTRGPVAATASFGVSALAATNVADAKALLAESDRELYRAKAQGRNQVCAAALQVAASVPTKGRAIASSDGLSFKKG